MTMLNDIDEFLEGNELDVFGYFKVAGVLTDPTTVKFKMRRADTETTTELTLGTDAEVKRDSAGTFRYSGLFAVGTWLYWWVGTGLAAGTCKGTFRVLPLDSGIR